MTHVSELFKTEAATTSTMDYREEFFTNDKIIKIKKKIKT